MKTNTKYGLALSGGGARGVAHLGILQAMEENGFFPSVLSGTSMGALVAVSYAAGLKPREIIELINKEAKPFSFSHANWKRDGIFTMKGVEKILRERIVPDDFKTLTIPVYITVTNLNTGKFEIHSEGKLIDYALASASIPIVFKPVVMDDVYYVDGGLTKNMAAHILKGKCDIIIGVNVNPIAIESDFKRMKEIAARTYYLSVDNTIRDELNYCQYIVTPIELRNFSPFDFNKADEIFDIGYKEGLILARKLKATETNKRSLFNKFFGKKVNKN